MTKTPAEFLEELENYFTNILEYHSGDNDAVVKKDDICKFVLLKIKQFQAEQKQQQGVVQLISRCVKCGQSTEGKECDMCERCGNLAHSDCMTMNEEYACICINCYEILAEQKQVSDK
jgi:hypothetical protein